jgi:hypothetical protein
MFWLNKSSSESSPRHFGYNTHKKIKIKLPLKCFKKDKKKKRKNTGTWGVKGGNW